MTNTINPIQLYPNLDDTLNASADQAWQSLLSNEAWHHWPTTHPKHPSWLTVLALSDFARDLGLRYPETLQALINSTHLHQQHDMTGTKTQFEQRLSVDKKTRLDTSAALDEQLRMVRNRELFIITWRDILGIASIEESMLHLSLLADWSIAESCHWHYRHLLTELGIHNQQCMDSHPLMILGMGKLGGYELNFSSDIDLIFFYPGNAYQPFPGSKLNNEQFFTRLGQRLIASLNKMTKDGFVFRVDMRLRPYGDSGPIAMSTEAAEDYYHHQGRDWERYAMIKARCITGKAVYKEQLYPVLKPFVFRKYIDFSVLESIREMKELIQKELRRKKLDDNIKLGAGGIREVEFIVQSFQLIRGGREHSLQGQSLLEVFKHLAYRGYIDQTAYEQCHDAYFFLRKLEHALQEIADQQTQRLPHTDLDKERIRHILGFQDYDALLSRLQHHKSCVHQHFRDLIGEPDNEPHEQDELFVTYQDCWLGVTPENGWSHLFQQEGYQKPEVAAHNIESFMQSGRMKGLGRRGKKRLDRVMPKMLQLVGKTHNPDDCLTRVLELVTAILQRTAYLVLLDEHYQALEHMVNLCSASQWISLHLTRYPILLDELLDHRLLLSPPDSGSIEQELAQLTLRLNDDTELHMEVFRQFKFGIMLKVAAANISGVLSVTELSHRLTTLAELLLQRTVLLALRELSVKYGLPTPMQDISDIHQFFAILAYGKFGSREMSLSSDLDIVFLHRLENDALTNGEQAIENSRFIVRLAQRVIHLLSLRTGLGRLYEVDVRLRPSGNAGLLVTHVDAFEQYQSLDAWVWEHQALLKARCVLGSGDLVCHIDTIRTRVLLNNVRHDQLKTEVASMRDKMRGQLDKSRADDFDLKQGKGGLVDIEFLLQYWVLKHSATDAALLEERDAVRTIKALKKRSIVKADTADYLTDALMHYRQGVNQCALQGKPAVLPEQSFKHHIERITALWERTLGQEDEKPQEKP